MRFRLLPYPILLLATACVPLGTPITNPDLPASQQQRAGTPAASPQLRYYDYVYDPSVKSVQCYVGTGTTSTLTTTGVATNPTAVLSPPIVPLSQEQPITLEFDVLGEQPPRLTAKLINCDINWQPSTLTDLQFLNDINEFNVNSYRTSVNTKVPYYHYTLAVPRVKLSGNYLLVVQGRGGVPLISRRLLVYENQVAASLVPGMWPGACRHATPISSSIFASTTAPWNCLTPLPR